MWGHQFFKEEHVQKNISRKGNNEAFVYRVILHYDEPVLTASWKTWFSKFKSKRLTLVEKNVVFSLTNTQTGEVYVRQIPLTAGWNEGENDLLFKAIPRGSYELYFHVRRDYKGGRHDQGSRNRGKFNINLM